MTIEFKLLDHGYIKLIENWGSEERIIEAARMSTGKGFLGWGEGNKVGDEKLLKYLYENAHSTPFEMAGMILEVKAPIFVFREWHRHRTQSYNEMSARYTPLPDENYMPTIDRLLTNSKTNKQAGTIKDSEELTVAKAHEFQKSISAHYSVAEAIYQEALSSGVPKELARIHLPVGRYSRMRASANLRNWLAFMTLRCAPTAQMEIRLYADKVANIVSTLFPRTFDFWIERQFGK